METLLEIIMEIVMEGTLYTAGNKKVSLWIRIPLILVLLLFFGFIIAGSFLTGIIIVKKEGFFKGLNIFVYPCKGHLQAAMLHGLDSRRQEAGCKCLHVFGTSFCCCHSISEKRNIAFVRKQVLYFRVYA